MNMLVTKPELLCPSFPMLQVSGEFEVKDNTVSFELESGCATLKCKIVADVVREVRVVGSILHPEDSKDQFYDQLVVDDRTHVEVLAAEYVEAPLGLLFQLTTTQVNSLNEQLKYYAEELADEEAGAV
ncbi:hypothetical protein ACEVN9_002763 [Acinetobacter baumannii]